MSRSATQYYYGSYGLIRGYGTLYRSLDEADSSVFTDGRLERRNGGSTDRNAVAVCPDTGLCWWPEEGYMSGMLEPVKTADGKQARYELEMIRSYEDLWHGPVEIAGFG